MASLDSVQIRQALAEGVVVQAGTDVPVAFRLRYVGSGTVTSVTVTTADKIVMVTSDGGTDTYDFHTTPVNYPTLGAVVDAINADGIFEAKVLDDLRSSASASQWVAGAVSAGADANGVRVWDVLVDTSVAARIPVCLTGARNFDAPKTRRPILKELSYTVDMGTAAADSVQIWLRRGATETKVFSALSVKHATNVTTINFAGGQGEITGKDGDEIVALVKGDTLANATGNFVRVVGRVE